MKRLEISKILFYTISITGLIGLSFAFGLYSAAKETVVFETVRTLKDTVEESLNLLSEEATTITKIHPKHFLQPAHYEGDGITVNDVFGDEDELILLSGFFNDSNELRIIQRDGTIVARWPVRFSEIFPDDSHMLHPPATDWNIDTHGALALPDGSVVFNFEVGGLVKLDRCANVVWTLAKETHHSVELSEGGGFWVPGRRVHSKESDSPFPPFQTPLIEDLIMKVSEEGKVIKEISVLKLLYDNRLESLLTSNGQWFWSNIGHWDLVHLNKIAELSSDIEDDFPIFKAGDLALSLRQYNLILIVDPDTRKIKWWRIGPWLRQHDPEFIPGGKLIVFNNNIYVSAKGGGFKKSVSVPRVSNIVEINPVSNKHRVIYGGIRGQEMLTVLRGKHEITRNGGLLITEFEGGRVFEIDGTGRIIWEYINRYDSDEVAEITEARIYPASYFRVSDWSCE